MSQIISTSNYVQLGFLEDTTQVDVLVPRLRKALKNATGGTNKASELSFSQLQIELDTISRDNLLKVSASCISSSDVINCANSHNLTFHIHNLITV